MSTSGFYIYCVVPFFKDEPAMAELEKSGISSIHLNGITALASPWKEITFDFSDRESLSGMIIHHQKTIEALVIKGFRQLIPFRVGTVSSDRNEIIRILAAGYDLITETFRKIDTLTEIDLAVTWSDFSSMLKNLSIRKVPDTHAEVNLSDMVGIHDAQMKKWLKMRSGLQEKSTAAELKILDYLSGFCIDIKQHEVMNYQMITNSAFLLNLSSVADFERIVGQLNTEFEGALNFKLIGPIPCYSFFTLETKKVTQEKINRANIELGLRQELSESAIKEAYQRKRKLFHSDVKLHEGEEDYFNSVTSAYHTLMEYSATIRQGLYFNTDNRNETELPEEIIMVNIKK